MDVYRFVDSRDIRAHLLKIGYQLTTQEAAFLVWHCETATLEEKILAWEEIARSMPNCSLEGRANMEPIPDFRRLERYRKNGDISDMGCYGYGISLYGAKQDTFLWSDDFSFASYLDVELFRNPLEGAHKVLKPVSLYLKRKCNLELLINSFVTLRQRSATEGALEKMRGAYLPECLKEVDMDLS